MGIDGKDKTAEAHALACLKAHPGEFVPANGDSADTILDLISQTPVHREIIAQKADEKRRELEGPNPSPLEVLLVDRIVACWLSVDFYEDQFVRKSKGGASMSISVSQHLQDRIDKSQKRYLAAIKTLAQVRRLQVGIPVNVQVNVAAAGGQQVNINGGLTVPMPPNAV